MAEDFFAKLRDAVVNYDEKAVVELSQEVVNRGLDPLEVIEKGLSEGAKTVGDKFDKMEIFLTELMMAGEALKAGLKILLPQIQKERISKKGSVVIGTVKGDIHEIGKNIVAALLQANGFEVHDLGVDVDIARFIEKAEEANADIIALSALMSSTIGGQKDVIDYLKATGRRERYIVMVGGGPTTEEWAEEIGADGYAETASEAVNVALGLIQKKVGA